jgi:multidrug resistance efflux pump
MFVTYGGQTLRAADWSLGGLRLEGFGGAVPAPGDHIDLKLSMPFQGFDVAFAAKGQVVRSDAETGMFALRFTELGEREQELLRHFIEELVRGSMSDVADTIQRIDLPVTPVSTKPDVNPGEVVPVNRWPLKTIFFTALYSVLGLFVFSYIAMLGYTNVFRLEVDSAVISAPMVTVQAPNDGHVMWTSFKPGDVIKAGAVVLQVADNQLERDIDLADIDIREKQARLAASQHMLADALSQLEDLSTVEGTRIEQAKARLASLKAAAFNANAILERLRGQFNRGYATRTQLDLAERDAIAAQSAAKTQAFDLSSQSAMAASSTGSRFFTGNQFLGERARMEADVKLSEAEIGIAQQRKRVLMEQRLRLAVIAPFDGLVLELPRVDHSPINRGDVIAVLEQPRSRMVTAYLTQDEVLHVGIGDPATVYVPAFDATLTAKVTSIDRTSGFAKEMEARFNFRNTRDRSALVTLQFATDDVARNVKTFRSGTPVIVIFKSRSTNEIVKEITAAFNALPGFGGASGTPVENRSFPQEKPKKGQPAPAPKAVKPAPAAELRPSQGSAPALPPLRPSQDAISAPSPMPLRPTLPDLPIKLPPAEPLADSLLRGV